MRLELKKQQGWEYMTTDGGLKDKLLSFEYCSLGKYKGKTFMIVNTKNKTNEGYDCISEDYLLLVTEMESYKKPRVFGGGYITVPTLVVCDEKHYDRTEVFYNTARETLFGTDCDEDASYSGYTYNQYWNGWECPYFTKKVCDKILSDSFTKTSETTWESELDGYKYWYDKDTDTYMEQIPEGELYPLGSPYEINGNRVYDLGAGNWCWCEEKEELE